MSGMFPIESYIAKDGGLDVRSCIDCGLDIGRIDGGTDSIARALTMR